MKLIVGLGNPGEKYKKTYHNLGFSVLDEFKKNKNLKIQSSKLDKKFEAEIIKGKLGKEKIILAKPQTFMNNSGITVSKIFKFYKIKPQDIWIICDDINLPLGKLRIRSKGSSGGHNGLESIISELKNSSFVRFRIGIGKPFKKIRYEKYVLQKIKKNEIEIIKESINKTAEAIKFALENDIEKTKNKFN